MDDTTRPSVVALRPMTPDDVDLVAVSRNSVEGTGEFQWFGFTDTTTIRRRFDDDGLLGPDGGMLAVVADGLAVGFVEWFRSNWGRPSTSSCWSLAVGLVVERRGQGIGTEAHRLLVRYLFAHTRVERVQAWTDVANVAEQRALEASGFQVEGRLRRAQWRGGRWHDQLLYSVLRDDVS